MVKFNFSMIVALIIVAIIAIPLVKVLFGLICTMFDMCSHSVSLIFDFFTS